MIYFTLFLDAGFVCFAKLRAKLILLIAVFENDVWVYIWPGKYQVK